MGCCLVPSLLFGILVQLLNEEATICLVIPWHRPNDLVYMCESTLVLTGQIKEFHKISTYMLIVSYHMLPPGYFIQVQYITRSRIYMQGNKDEGSNTKPKNRNKCNQLPVLLLQNIQQCTRRCHEKPSILLNDFHEMKILSHYVNLGP